jgi:hypothetical protein
MLHRTAVLLSAAPSSEAAAEEPKAKAEAEVLAAGDVVIVSPASAPQDCWLLYLLQCASMA